MEELASILTTLSEYLNINKIAIISGDTPQAATARGLTCYILEEGFPHLMQDFAVMAGMELSAVYAVASKTAARIKDDIDLYKTANRLRRKVGMQALKRISKRRAVSATKQLFGFDYTYREELAYEKACRDASAFMEEFCKGKQPIEDGFITKRRKTRFSI